MAEEIVASALCTIYYFPLWWQCVLGTHCHHKVLSSEYSE